MQGTDLADRIAAVAGEAGALAMARWQTDFRRWEKSPGNPVCEVDLEVDAFLRDHLGRLDPDAGWLSEETVDNEDRLACRRVWVVDPIDGTRDYLRGREGWAVSVALVENGQPVIAVLDCPPRAAVFRAAKGRGASLNDASICAATRDQIAGARVPSEALPKVDRDLTAVYRPNSIALRIAMVACAEADLVATLRWGHEWDIAAAVLIAREAGAQVTDALGDPLLFNTREAETFGVLVTAHGLHGAAVERLRSRAETAPRR